MDQYPNDYYNKKNEMEYAKTVEQLRKELLTLQIRRRIDKLCLECGSTYHKASRCIMRICPVCKSPDNHFSYLDCPFLACQLCGEKHPLNVCKLRPVTYFLKCQTCGNLGHTALECADIQVGAINLETMRNKCLEDPKDSNFTDYKKLYKEFHLRNHNNNVDYFKVWAKILLRIRREREEEEKKNQRIQNRHRKHVKRF